MSATESLLGRSLFFAASCATRQTALAAALVSVMMVAPAFAQTDIEKNDAAQSTSRAATEGLGTVIGAVGAAGAAHLLGANRLVTVAAGFAGGIFGLRSGGKMADAQEKADRDAGLLSPKVEAGGPKMSEQLLHKYDELAITAAAYRLLVQVSASNFQTAKEMLALSPRDLDASKSLLAAQKEVSRNVAGLNVALTDFSNATDTLSKRYTGTDFRSYRALFASISAPSGAIAAEVSEKKPIYEAALARAQKIHDGDVSRLGGPGQPMSQYVVGQSNSLETIGLRER